MHLPEYAIFATRDDSKEVEINQMLEKNQDINLMSRCDAGDDWCQLFKS